MINSENQKSKDLTTLLKLREKSLIDRTKGQIAWLELQKQKFKEKGLTAQISAVKKKQRAILVSLDKERASIHRYDGTARGVFLMDNIFPFTPFDYKLYPYSL